MCGFYSESTIHAIRDCEVPRQLWKSLVKPEKWGGFFGNSFQDWVNYNTRLDVRKDMEGRNWTIVFLVALAHYWFWQNKIANEAQAIIPSNMKGTVLSRVDEVERAKASLRLKKCRHRDIKWSPQPVGWIKFNVDASIESNPKAAIAAGLARDDNGKWLLGFGTDVGWATTLKAEL